MKNKLIIIFFIFSFYTKSLAENILIEAKNIILDKDNVTSTFENEVIVKLEIK